MATASEDDTVKIYDVATRQVVKSFDKHHQNVAAVAFHPDGKLVASGTGGMNDERDGSVLVWDLKSGEVRLTLGGISGPVSALRFSPDGRRLYAATGSQAVRDRGSVVCWEAPWMVWPARQ